MAPEESHELVRTERLARLGALLAGFAHEVRNPLSTIGLNLQLVKEDFADAQTARDKRTYKRLDVVEAEVRRLQSILDEFLTFARRPQLEKVPTDLNAMLRALTDFTEPEMEKAGIALRFYPGGGPMMVQADPDLLRAAVVNLLLNAQDACRQGDEILVSTAREGDRVAVRVTDTGTGITADTLDRIFTPYFSTKKKGTGLGLPTTRRIVEEHEGTLEVSSEVGKGTQFTLYLPVRAPEPRIRVDGEDMEP